jgi:hypothetical protein
MRPCTQATFENPKLACCKTAPNEMLIAKILQREVSDAESAAIEVGSAGASGSGGSADASGSGGSAGASCSGGSAGASGYGGSAGASGSGGSVAF